MHELGIAQDLFRIVEEKAKENNLKKVTKIKIKLGTASGIEKEFLQHSFIDHILPNSIAKEATIEIISETPSTKCKNCGKEVYPSPLPRISCVHKNNSSKQKCTSEKLNLACPACGSFNIEIIKGKDVYIENIEGSTSAQG